jgi:uncharacterized membrane protein
MIYLKVFSAVIGLFILWVLVRFIYVIVKRIEDKKNEDFEKRDN